MTNEEAIQIICEIPGDSDGDWFQLRLGSDPGPRRILQLRMALRVAWRAFKDQDAIPFPVAAGAAAILHFAAEAKSNLPTGVRAELVELELPDLVQGAFDLLSGPMPSRGSWHDPISVNNRSHNTARPQRPDFRVKDAGCHCWLAQQ